MANPNIVAKSLTFDITWLSDINTNFENSVPQTLVYAIEEINGLIINVLTTRIGEEWWEPLYGSNLPLRVFDPINDTTAWLLQHDIEDALATWVPLITVDRSSSKIKPYPDLKLYDIQLAYVVPSMFVKTYYQFQVGPNQG